MSDGLRGCEKCGNDTTGRLCNSCREQEIIDAEPWLDEPRPPADARTVIAALVDIPAAMGMPGWSMSAPSHVICSYCGALASNIEDIQHDEDCPVEGGLRWLSDQPVNEWLRHAEPPLDPTDTSAIAAYNAEHEIDESDPWGPAS